MYGIDELMSNLHRPEKLLVKVIPSLSHFQIPTYFQSFVKSWKVWLSTVSEQEIYIYIYIFLIGQVNRK